MLKLPVCPHCGARFLYPDVRRSQNKAAGTCPHCGGTFRISGRRGRTVLFAVSSLILAGINFGLLGIPSINLTVLLAATALGVACVRLLIPYTVRYRP